jgi:hypothetical protein
LDRDDRTHVVHRFRTERNCWEWFVNRLEDAAWGQDKGIVDVP